MIAAAVVVLALGVPSQLQAEDRHLPKSCQLHPTHAIDPGCAPALTGNVVDPGETLPNIMPDVRFVEVLQSTFLGPVTLTFVPFGPPPALLRHLAQNLGAVPLQLTVDDIETASAAQCVAWTADRLCRKQRPVGGFHYHPEHAHTHFEEYARYELRRVGPTGAPTTRRRAWPPSATRCRSA